VLENGRVALQGGAADLLARDDIKRFYLGENAEGRARFIDPHRRRRGAAVPARPAA
jgi:hypothetical protein